MQLVVVDTSPPLRAALLGRVQEACRQAGLQRITALEVDPLNLDTINWDVTIGCFLGVGCSTMIKELLGKLQGARSECPLAIVLDAETYVAEAVAIHKILGRVVVNETDLTQMATFVVDCERQAAGRPMGIRARHVVGVAQLKGGVGGTTLAAALGGFWARDGRTVALVDLDDVSPQITEWARVAPAQRLMTGELLRSGEVTIEHLRDLVHPVDGFDGRLVAVGQPLAYAEGFHFKSYVLDGAPSASEFVVSLISLLSAEYDVVVLDMGRSWGVSTFAALPWCERVLFLLEDDGLAVRRSLDALGRLKRESGDPEEFNLAKWSVAFNKVTGKRLKEQDIVSAVEEIDVFPKGAPVLSIRFSEAGRQWGAPGQTFYDLADATARRQIATLGEHLVPSKSGGAARSARPERRWRDAVGGLLPVGTLTKYLSSN